MYGWYGGREKKTEAELKEAINGGEETPSRREMEEKRAKGKEAKANDYMIRTT